MSEDSADIAAPAIEDRETGTAPRRRAVHRASLHEQVVEKLRLIISRGDLAAGERINEAALSEALGVSRTPMREAVKLLASEGILELLPGRGARVKRFSAEELHDIFEVIGALERHAVETVVGGITPQGFAEIEKLQSRMEAELAARNRRAYFLVNQRMHALLVKLAGNPTLSATHEALTKKARHDRHITLMSDERWLESAKEHAAIHAAITARDARQAGLLMLEHSRQTGAAIIRMENAEPAGTRRK